MSLFFSLNRANVRHSSLSLALKNILPGNWIQTRFLTQVYYELFQALAIRSEYRMKIIMVIDGWTKNKTTKNIIFWLDCWFLSFDLFFLLVHAWQSGPANWKRRCALSVSIFSLPAIHNYQFSFFFFPPVPPEWISKPKNLEAIEGEDVFFPCRVSGVPEPMITWRKLAGE